jgi:phosphopantothenoylcysteine decarboxylase/phosphopantothenate--cysteine ligase
MQPLSGKKILLGITGSIAAYKSIQLVRDLTAAGAEVQVVLTPAAHPFVPSLTLQIFSKNNVYSDLFSSRTDILHVTLASGFDLNLIAPVTANFIAKMATGMADNLLSAILLSSSAPVLIAPAMDLGMWDHPAVQRNVALLKERGYIILNPEWGALASGLSGIGRMTDPQKIFDKTVSLLQNTSEKGKVETPLAGEVVLVTAGPTREAIDPVRFISNRSSGKMGYALAHAAREMGAKVILISGPTSLAVPCGIESVFVQSTAEMKAEIERFAPSASIVIMSAAVSDYTPLKRSNQKLKRAPKLLELIPTDDLLKGISKQKNGKFLVGFAAETENLHKNAWAKLKAKGLDLIVANDVTQEGAGFDVDSNIVEMIDATGQHTSLPKMHKSEVARHILNEVIRLKSKMSKNPRRKSK